MLVIGSHALGCHTNLGRVPKDIDVMGTPAELDAFLAYDAANIISSLPQGDKKQIIRSKRFGYIDFELAWRDSTAEEFMALCRKTKTSINNGFPVVWVPSIDDLYALKKSHRFLRNSPHFQKTRQDLLRMERELNASVPDYLAGWLKRREAETYSYGHPKLNQGKGSFFSGDGIDYVYDHDTIHKSMAIGRVPAYTLFQRLGSEVAVDRDRWDELTEHQRLCSVVEESYVLAIERSQVPFPNTAPERSFRIALMKVCTSITSGWWREYAYTHYDAAVDLYHRTESRRGSYVDKFRADVARGLVLPFNAGTSAMTGSKPELAVV